MPTVELAAGERGCRTMRRSPVWRVAAGAGGRESRRMRQVWEPEDLLASWTLLDADWELVANKSGATRLGFALLLKFFELEARFPRDRGEVPAAAVAFVADQVGVPAGELLAEEKLGGVVIGNETAAAVIRHGRS